MLLWLIISIAFLAAPLALMFVWISNDDRGPLIIEKKVKTLDWLNVLVVISFLITCGAMIFMIYSFINEVEDNNGRNWFSIIGAVVWILLAFIVMIYPVSVFRKARLEGRKLNMWDHLSARKEIIFPWEFNPVATNVAAVYFIGALAVLAIALYFILEYLLINPPLKLILPLGLFLIGAYICYLILKPEKS